MELEMELSGEWCDLEDESYDDILSVSSMGAFRKEKGDKIHKNSKK